MDEKFHKGVIKLELQNNIFIEVNRINAISTRKGAFIYSMIGKITISGKEYTTLKCIPTVLGSAIYYLDDGTEKEYSFNISNFII